MRNGNPDGLTDDCELSVSGYGVLGRALSCFFCSSCFCFVSCCCLCFSLSFLPPLSPMPAPFQPSWPVTAS